MQGGHIAFPQKKPLQAQCLKRLISYFAFEVVFTLQQLSVDTTPGSFVKSLSSGSLLVSYHTLNHGHNNDECRCGKGCNK